MSRVNPTDPQMEQGAHVPRHYSTFPMGNNQFITCRFGEYVPFFVFDSYEKDKVRQRSITTTRSLSLKAPLMEDINLKRDYFQVYYDALLPINWDKCYVRPKRGDIVSWQSCSTNVPNFPELVRSMCFSVWTGLSFDASMDFRDVMRTLVFIEMFYSNGSLINHFGAHMSSILKVTYYPFIGSGLDSKTVTTDFDSFLDNFSLYLLWLISSSSSNILVFNVGAEMQIKVEDAVSMRLFLSSLRENSITSLSISDTLKQSIAEFLDQVGMFWNDLPHWSFNLAPLWAYQIACAHFYSDDNVDYVFSAELFRSLIGSYISQLNGFDVFLYNGLRYEYDYLSARYFSRFVTRVTEQVALEDVVFAYFAAIFGFNRSLRYQDYFSGARTNPIAVGDETEITVNDNKVSVIDVTQSIQWQRLLNNIQRLPQEIGRFIQSSTGKGQSFDYHNPGWLAHTKDIVFAAEVENTGEAQQTLPNSVTATLRGKSSDKEFTFESDRPCILIGVQYFDIRRAYFTGVRRTLQLDAREDMFMPELQYIGDQPIYQNELISYSEGLRNFGYTEQYQWLKVNYDEAMGGFVNGSLPGWAFLFRPEFFRVNYRGDIVVSPNFIRSIAPELDDFFLSLTGFSLGTYFHFQQKVVNITSASRNMVRHSQILG